MRRIVRVLVVIFSAVGRPIGRQLPPTVNVVYGAHDIDMDLAGLTVAEIRLSLRDAICVGDHAEAYIDGTPAEDGMILRGGQRLEFVKPFGRKAGSPPFLRYAGGKSKPKPQQAIMSKRPRGFLKYRELFVGAGSLALRIDEYYGGPIPVWINDRDPHLIAVWLAVRDRPHELVEMCLSLPHYRGMANQRMSGRTGKSASYTSEPSTTKRWTLLFGTLCATACLGTGA